MFEQQAQDAAEDDDLAGGIFDQDLEEQRLTAGELDAQHLDSEEVRISTQPQVYDEEEKRQLNEIKAKLGSVQRDKLKPLTSSDWKVDMARNASLGLLQGTTVVDASVARCAAFNMHKTERDTKKVVVSAFNGHRFMYKAVVDYKIAGIAPRVFAWMAVWEWENDDDLVVAYEPFVPGSSTILVLLQKLPPLEDGVPQTRVTYTQQTGANNKVPKTLADRFAAAQLRPLCEMREALDQSEKIDGDKRLEFEEMVRAHNQPYTEEELEVIEKGQDLHELFEGEKGKVVRLPSSLATAKVAYKKGERKAYGWATTTVRAR
ncbi:hypothetical protein TeGR_g14444 [Tetraparma gracilis]|uniref:Uncharacterized protein n=1 Tax=Tetraparma gracilis TaxID=2962635 RepID=A0ABQ6ML62_9STRA|nr:hypothetical protein TeGR_g14444 [Tetraparma gracilis]